VPACNAIVGIDLADKKQMVVVTDHDSKVLARRTFRCRAWDLGVALDWADERAARGGFAGATVACEPTGHRWRVVGQLAADRGLSFVCVQTLMTSWARRSGTLGTTKGQPGTTSIVQWTGGGPTTSLGWPIDVAWIGSDLVAGRHAVVIGNRIPGSCGPRVVV